MLKIYKIVDNTNGNIYIGKTKNTLEKRLFNHESAYKQYINKKRNTICSSHSIIKNGDYRIELIEETQDKTRERYFIENTECINHNIPYQTREEKLKYQKKEGLKRNKYYKSWGGSPYEVYNLSLLKIDPNLFF